MGTHIRSETEDDLQEAHDRAFQAFYYCLMQKGYIVLEGGANAGGTVVHPETPNTRIKILDGLEYNIETK